MASVPVSDVSGHDHVDGPIVVIPAAALPPGPRWRVVPLGRQPKEGGGRPYTFELIAPLIDGDDVPDIPDDHLNDIVAVVAELASNAIKATREAPHPPPGVLPAIELGLHVTERYAHILVRDAVPVEPRRRASDDLAADIATDDGSDVHGFGLGIVEALCADWWTVMRKFSKTVHAVVARPGLMLTREELEALRR